MFLYSHNVIHLSKNLVYHKKMLHADVKYHFIRELMKKGAMKIQNVAIKDNPTDMGTKNMTTKQVKQSLDLLHVNTS